MIMIFSHFHDAIKMEDDELYVIIVIILNFNFCTHHSSEVHIPISEFQVEVRRSHRFRVNLRELSLKYSEGIFYYFFTIFIVNYIFYACKTFIFNTSN